MDIPNTIIGVILLIALIAPIVTINKRISNRRKLFVNKINVFAADDHKKVIDFDTWTNNSIIGLSSDNKVLYFMRDTDTYSLNTKIDLNDIKHFSIKENKESQKINLLELIIELNSNNNKIALEFFKADDKNFIMGEEMRIAKKWFDKLAEETSKAKMLFI